MASRAYLNIPYSLEKNLIYMFYKFIFALCLFIDPLNIKYPSCT